MNSPLFPSSENFQTRLIIGIGNELRGDDGIGRFIARTIAKEKIKGTQVVEGAGIFSSLIEVLKGYNQVWLIDAVSSCKRPGNVYRFDASDSPLPKDLFNNLSTHSLGLAETIEMARVLGQLPKRVIVYGIEGESFDKGAGLSQSAQKACEEVVKRLIEDLQA